MHEIVQIPLFQLDPHPRNPRRAATNVEDLAASIKAQGIRQNLLVVPHPDEPDAYRVIIGHRRMVAAGLAGLTTVPCAVAELDEQQQMELMLVENLQRTDLSPVEEAAGYQDMLDMGVDVATIAKRTGRSKSTVQQRLKLTGLPEPVREKVHLREATLEDAVALEGLPEDLVMAPNGPLEYLGTTNFQWALKQARISAEFRAELAGKVEELRAADLTEFEAEYDEETEDEVLQLPEGYRAIHYTRWSSARLEDLPADELTKDCAFLLDGAGELVMLYPVTLDEQAAENGDGAVVSEQERKRLERRAEEEQRRREDETARELRRAFIDGLQAFSPKQREKICTAAIPFVTRDSYTGLAIERRSLPQADLRWELVFLYAMQEQCRYQQLATMGENNRSGACLLVLYGLLVDLGYTPSDVERDLIEKGKTDAAAKEAAREVAGDS